MKRRTRVTRAAVVHPKTARRRAKAKRRFLRILDETVARHMQAVASLFSRFTPFFDLARKS